jgi:hypothetical protein
VSGIFAKDEEKHKNKGIKLPLIASILFISISKFSTLDSSFLSFVFSSTFSSSYVSSSLRSGPSNGSLLLLPRAIVVPRCASESLPDISVGGEVGVMDPAGDDTGETLQSVASSA